MDRSKGLSLFVVPKFGFDLETGELTGERNGVFATNLEKKMGIKASTTCELTFGDAGVPAKGWLLGEVHDGIAQMFRVIEHARMLVGTGDRHPVHRVSQCLGIRQDASPGCRPHPGGRQDRATGDHHHHPDVRRSLMTQKSFTEGLRALLLYAATIQDRNAIARAHGTTDNAAERLNDLLLPIVKGYGSERSWVLLERNHCRPSAAPVTLPTIRSSSTFAMLGSTPSTRARPFRARICSSARS